MNKEQSITNADIIENSIKKLFPTFFNNEKVALSLSTVISPEIQKNQLDCFYLFPIKELSIDFSINDVQNFIFSRFQTLLSACYFAGITVSTVIKGEKDKINLFLGFKDDTGKTNRSYYESLVKGMLPGRKHGWHENHRFSSLCQDMKWGGLIRGIPPIRYKEEKQFFNISNVLKSMYGQRYLLAIIANPIKKEFIMEEIQNLSKIKDHLHALSKINITETEGKGLSKTDTQNRTYTKQDSYGESINPNIIILKLKQLVGGKISSNKSTSESNSETTGTSTTETTNESSSYAFEQQNNLIIELEKYADECLKRTIDGFNIGLWETIITYITEDEQSCKILGGSFIGELSKPRENLNMPPELFIQELNNRLLLLPSDDNTTHDKWKNSGISTFLTSQELSQIAAPPYESLPGYEITKNPILSMTDISNTGEIPLGIIVDRGNPIEGAIVKLSLQDINKHLFICGLTGSGKTTTVKHILKSLCKLNIPFLVIESAKKDYRQLFGDKIFRDKLNIFTIGDPTVSPIRINPFYIQPGIHPLTHIDYLKAIFNASFSLYGPMPHIIEKCLHNVYIKRGWDLTTGKHPHFVDIKGNYCEDNYQHPEHLYCFPTLTDLKNEIDDYVKNELQYRGELSDNIRTAIIVRLESLCIGAKGHIFNTYDFYPLNKLLSSMTIMEMESLSDDDDKAFFVGLMLILISEYRQKENPAVNPGTRMKGLQHLLIIEEAHRLLKNVSTERTSEMIGNPKGKAVEVFCNMIAEMRSCGQGVCVVEQIPSKISPDVIKNSNTKIVHRLVAKDDQTLLAGSLGIDDESALYLNHLITGNALCHKEGMEKAIEIRVLNDIDCYAISDEKIYRIMKDRDITPLHCFTAYELSELLGKEGKALSIRLLNSLCVADAGNLSSVLDLAYVEIKRLTILKNQNKKYSEDDYSEYFVKTFFEILSNGIYCMNKPFPSGIKSQLSEFFKNKTFISLQNVCYLFAKYWDTDNAENFIKDVVSELARLYCYSNNIELSSGLYKIVESYFIAPKEGIVEEIISNIFKKEIIYESSYDIFCK